ncbi:MAG: prepilin peptidase [Planctomycetaceae bacterium]|jgi:hypothetical protein|nr:prepilin peptidase [Planctomycetaceae bacterium]
MSLASIFCVVLVIVFGCCIGSFLNVVIYRLPLGKSLSYPPSHCPKCKSLIRPYDNFPVFGWFLLRGRCRDCRALISWRYPFVEAIAGVMAGSISAAVFYSREGNSDFELVVISLYYFGLVVTLLAAGLIEFDQNIPKPVLAVGFAHEQPLRDATLACPTSGISKQLEYKIPAKLFVPMIIITPPMLYYFNYIKFYTILNGTNFLHMIAGTIICCCVVVFIGFPYFAQPVETKKRTAKKQIRLQPAVPILTALTVGLGCGLIAVPILFFASVVAVLWLRYVKLRRMYLILTCAVWVTIIYVLARF